MIKSDKGELLVQGDPKDVIFELHHLIREMAKNNPEIISAVMYKNADSLQQAVKMSNNAVCLSIEAYIDHIERIREENNDED